MNKLIVAAIIVVLVAIGAFAFTRSKNTSNTQSASSSSSTTSPTPTTSPSPSSSSSTQSPQTTSSVTIANFAFTPASITVKKGTTVTWTNQDSTAHTVTETDGQDGPKSSELGNGQAYSFTYNTAGTFKYHCSIHPDMTGTVTVTE